MTDSNPPPMNSQTQLVYRVEDPQGRGPYVGAGYGVHRWSNNVARHGSLPEPREELAIRSDPRYTIDGSWFCGFSTIADMEQWFTMSERHALSRLGFRLAVYEVENRHVIRGSWQTVFRLQCARKITYRLLSPVDKTEEMFHDFTEDARNLAPMAQSSKSALYER